MKNIIYVMLLAMLVCLQSPQAQAAVSVMGSGYNPRMIYSGPFQDQVLYYRYPGYTLWQRGYSRELDSLACRPAVISFKTSGTWQGHLKPDGSCGSPAEPAEWALGNRLNYDRVPISNKR
ncbi:hypothetical protein [Pelotalea chapellei]|uniref:Uncharacterized protein n=1 Tax=Pelotalea chapellei TaxID=44671 RepID=A0ABS5U742_9BACT|nr:hypothetical protein [Pelotalea chapellei]MBT1071481.1 hypothetical protein [Pelotalea chapellei]